jgi:hypothetical protein
MPGAGTPPEDPKGSRAPIFKPPGSSNIGLPTDPRFGYAPFVGCYLKTTSGPSPRPLMLGEALEAQRREQENAACGYWTAEQERKRRTENKYTPSPSSVTSHQSSSSGKPVQEREDYSKRVPKDEELTEETKKALRSILGLYIKGLILLTGIPLDEDWLGVVRRIDQELSQNET